MGRVNLIKMVVLPQFLYTFQHIPIFINKSFFSTLDQQINSFLWCNKQARIRRKVIQLPKSKGGLALPNLRHYYWACNINKLLFWNNSMTPDVQPQWAQMEKSLSILSLWSVVCSKLPFSIKSVAKNPIVINTLKIWNQFGLFASSGLAPLFRNHLFPPSCSDLVFQTWTNKGLLTINDLHAEGVFSSFADLSVKFNLPTTHLFRFFQTRQFVKNQFPQFPNQPPDSVIDRFLSLNVKSKGFTSIVYDYICEINPTCLDSLRATWDQDLGITMSGNQWSHILELVHTSSICARHSLLQCKILLRVHYTNARLAKIYPDRNDVCNRCKQSPADYMHMFWTCPQLLEFWSAIFHTLNEVLSNTVDPDPLTALFGILSVPNAPKGTQQVIAFTTLLARRLILLKWTHSSPPTHNRWIQEVLQCIRLEKIRFSMRGSLKHFYKTWQPFLTHIDNLVINKEIIDKTNN